MIGRLRRILGVVLVIATVALVAAFATGRLTAVSTHGVSMEPGHRAGDLVVVARSERYELGQVVAYRDRATGSTVLHRIVGGDAAGFVLRGDNNGSDDVDRPPADALIGRQVLHVPALGRYVAGPGGLAAVGAVAVLLGLASALVPGRRPDARSGPDEAGAPDVPVAPAAPRRARRAAVIGGIVVVDVALAVGVVAAHVRGASTVEPPRVPTHSISLRYRASVPVSDTYPDGEIATGDVVFLRLADHLEVLADYAPTTPDEVRVHLRAVVTASNGWRDTFDLAEPVTAHGEPVRLAGRLDVRKLTGRVARVAAATGVPAEAADVVLEAVAEPAAVEPAGGEPVAARLTLVATELSWAPDGSPMLGATADGPAVTATAPVAAGAVVPAEPDGFPRSWRTPLLASFVVALGASLMLWPSRPVREVVAARSGAVPERVRVDAADLPVGVPRVQLTDPAQLDDVAAWAGQPVLERGDGWRAVVTPGTVYWVAPTTLPPPRT